jgi:tetratricopeptide (TPR) repeat protein
MTRFLPRYFIILASLAGFIVTALHAQMPGTQTELKLGTVCYEKGLYPEALKHLYQAVVLDPSSIAAHYYLALVSDDFCASSESCEPHTSTAVREYQKVLELDPAHKDALKNLARLTYKIGRPEDAERLYRRAATLDPNDPEALYSVAVLTWQRAYREVMSEKIRLGLRPRKPLIGLSSCAEVRRKSWELLRRQLRF